MNASIRRLAEAAQAVKSAPQTPPLETDEGLGAALRGALQSAVDGDAQRACTLIDQVAQAAGVPLTLDRPVVLAVHQPWFDVPASAFSEQLLERGYVPCWFEPDEPLPPADGAPTGAADAGVLIGLRYRDVPLWEVARYDFCVRHELSLAEAESAAGERAQDLMREYDRARALIDRAERYFDVYGPECALVAQGHVMASAVVRAVAHLRGVRVVAIENTFHSERLLWDDDAALPVVSSRARAVWLREGPRVTDAQADDYVSGFVARAKSLKSGQHASPSAAAPWDSIERGAEPGQRRIVLFGQVATDAAVLFGLRAGFTRQLDVIRTVAAYADRAGHALVVKLHPKEASGDSPLGQPYRRLSERQILADPTLSEMLARGAFTLDADNALDTDGLTDGADVCVAVNSQAGLEALVRGPEVVLCGDAFYGNLGFTHEADSPASLEVALDRALSVDGRRNRGSEAKRFFVTYLEGLCQPKTADVIATLCAPVPADLPPEPEAAVPAAQAPSNPGPTASAPSAPASPAASGPSRAEREAYGSGERQTAYEFESIRADHRARYDFAAACLTPELARARRGDGPLLGLDAFCGNGYGAAHMASAPHVAVQGIDASEDAIAVAQQHFGSDRAAFTALRFPCNLPESRFDFVTCFESIEHVEDDEGLLDTLARSLAPGGLLFLSAPNEATLPISENASFFRFHERHYREEDLVALAASKGLVLRARAGQKAYHTAGMRAVKPLPEAQMGLDAEMRDAHFLVLAFEKQGPEPRPAAGPSTGLRLDLGCGELGPKPGFEGVDIRALPGIKHVTDMFALDARFAESSVDELYCRHAFEHLSFADGERALACWARVLAPGGRLNLIIPDLRFHIAQFMEEDPNAPSPTNPAWTQRQHAIAGFWGWQREEGTVWDIHKSGYDFEMMRELLERFGFVDVVRVDDDPWHLNVLATRAS
ncbi:MAG: methyltransferase domain-containing protein [Planctomycetota bacterium]